MGTAVEIISNDKAWHGLVVLWSFSFATITPLWAWFLYPLKRRTP